VKQILGIIPARYASSRFPGKPLAELGRRPMIQWVYERALPAFDALYVATDDQRIMKSVEAFGGKVVMTSPSHTSGTERCAEALDLVMKNSGKSFTHVVNIQGDEPLIRPEPINELISCFNEEQVDIATLVQALSPEDDLFDENLVKVITDKNSRALYFSRAPVPWKRGLAKDQWKKDPSYLKHIGIYAYRASVLKEIAVLPPGRMEQSEALEQLRWLENGYTIRTKLTKHISIGVDTPEDLEKVRRLVEKKLI